MIAKITRGTRPGDIAAYLHGPGKANEHKYRDEDGREHEGGQVIGGNLGREGDRSGTAWATDIRAAVNTRSDIKKPVWQMSLRAAPGDRPLSDKEWAAAGQTVAERMGYADNPWVMVRHGEDHVHIVASRVNERGEVWHARQDFREAQRAATAIEKEYGLTQAPRQREGTQKMSAVDQRSGQREKADKLTAQRTEQPERTSGRPLSSEGHQLANGTTKQQAGRVPEQKAGDAGRDQQDKTARPTHSLEETGARRDTRSRLEQARGRGQERDEAEHHQQGPSRAGAEKTTHSPGMTATERAEGRQALRAHAELNDAAQVQKDRKAPEKDEPEKRAGGTAAEPRDTSSRLAKAREQSERDNEKGIDR